jgi:hypothetical protein
MPSYVCSPSHVHTSDSTPGKEHVDHHHTIVHDNGWTEKVGRCESPDNNHITEPSFVASVKEFFGVK